jgi:hypothetical protein
MFTLLSFLTKGLVSVHQKPKNFNVFLGPIAKELRDLEEGLIIKLDGNFELAKFFLLMGVFDKPARASILNSKLCTGQYGCIKCYQPGKRISRKDKDDCEQLAENSDDDFEELVNENSVDKEIGKKTKGNSKAD